MRRTPKNNGAPIWRHSDNTTRTADEATLNEYFETWIARKYTTSAKKSTPYRYEHWYRNHIEKALGGMKLRDLRRRDMIDFQALLAGESTPSTVNYTMILLNIILNDAVNEEMMFEKSRHSHQAAEDEDPCGGEHQAPGFDRRGTEKVHAGGKVQLLL